MASSNNNEVISKVSAHTIKKFELIEKYVETWAQKLLQNRYCNGVIFIDCMCNSGLYHDENNKIVYGTPIRVARILREAAGQYPDKKIYVYLNDNSEDKIEKLKENLPREKSNFQYSITTRDANELLREMGRKLDPNKKLHYFLLYDPYDASIDWGALAPFFRNWGEVMINHMVLDSIRSIKQVKSEQAIKKYEGTYLADFETLLPCGSNKTAYERRVEEIITSLKGAVTRRYYIAAFPFFNKHNSLQYDLIHCTSNPTGFKLYKTTAWKVFGDKSSIKNTHGYENQYALDLDGGINTDVDESCYFVKDIVSYIQAKYVGAKDVPFDEIWALLDEHPVFPSDGYRREIRESLKKDYGAKVSRSTISFMDRRNMI